MKYSYLFSFYILYFLCRTVMHLIFNLLWLSSDWGQGLMPQKRWKKQVGMLWLCSGTILLARSSVTLVEWDPVTVTLTFHKTCCQHVGFAWWECIPSSSQLCHCMWRVTISSLGLTQASPQLCCILYEVFNLTLGKGSSLVMRPTFSIASDNVNAWDWGYIHCYKI